MKLREVQERGRERDTLAQPFRNGKRYCTLVTHWPVLSSPPMVPEYRDVSPDWVAGVVMVVVLLGIPWASKRIWQWFRG